MLGVTFLIPFTAATEEERRVMHRKIRIVKRIVFSNICHG